MFEKDIVSAFKENNHTFYNDNQINKLTTANWNKQEERLYEHFTFQLLS